MSKIIRKMRLRRQAAAAAQAAAQQEQAKQAEQAAIANASAITDSGRQTDIVNDTTETPGQTSNRPANSTDDLTVYVNDMRNRRKKRGAALPQLSGVLGQVGALGV